MLWASACELFTHTLVFPSAAGAAVRVVVALFLLMDVIHYDVKQILQQAALTQARVHRGATAEVRIAGVHHLRLTVLHPADRVHTLCIRNVRLCDKQKPNVTGETLGSGSSVVKGLNY